MLKNFIFASISLFSSLFASEAIIVGIAGGTGSGKTTLAKKLQEAFPNESILICQDSYYKDLSALPMDEREHVNFDHPDSLDFILLKAHIEKLKTCETIQKPVYNFKTHTREKFSEAIHSARLVIVEGILLFAVPEMRDLFDIKIFIDTDDDVRILRRIERDIQERARDFNSVRDQYLLTVKPMHEAFVEPSKQHADLIVPRGGENLTALSVLISKLKEELSRKEQVACAP